jgi:hypothetical protein
MEQTIEHPDDAENDRLRRELRFLKASVTADRTQQASRIRARIVELEAETSRARAELFKLVQAEHIPQENQLAEHEVAVSNLVDALYAARGSLVDSNVIMAMQVLRDLRARMGIE